jgi:hypothetical protein
MSEEQFRRKIMQRQPVKSTNVESIGYDLETKTLQVEFKSGGVYQYAGVPPEMYADLLKAESIGRFVSQVVRSGRKGMRIEEEKKDASA